MTLLFVYGSLKQGFVNEHVNPGQRVAGIFRTRERLPMYLVDEGRVPCIVLDPGHGFQVVGELYRVEDEALAAMDEFERLGRPGGYRRVSIELERMDTSQPESVRAEVYAKQPTDIPPTVVRMGPLAEYRPEHASHFRW